MKRLALRPRRRLWPWITLVASLAAIMVLVVRLSAGPLYSGWVGELIAGKITARFGGEADIGLAGLSLGPDFEPVVHMQDISVAIPGTGRLSIDSAEIVTDWASLFSEPRRVSSLTFGTVLIDRDQRVAGNPVTLADPHRLLEDATAAVRKLGDARLVVSALTLRQIRASDQPRLILERAEITGSVREGDKVSLALRGRQGNRPLAVDFWVAPGKTADSREADLTLEGFDSNLVGDVLVGEPGGKPVPLSARAHLAWAPGKGIETASASADFRDLVIPELDNLLIRGGLALDYDAASATLSLRPSRLLINDGSMLVTGNAVFPGGPSPVSYHLEATGRLDRKSGSEVAGRIEGTAAPDLSEANVQLIKFSGLGLTFNAAASLQVKDGTRSATLSGKAATLPYAALVRLWPTFVSPKARQWVVEHITGADIHDVTVDAGLILAPGEAPLASHELSFRFSNLSANPVGDGPQIRDASGSGLLRDRLFQLVFTDGRGDAGDGRQMQITSGGFDVQDVDAEPPVGSITMGLAGDADSALAVWQKLPLSRGVELPVSLGDISGDARADVRLSLPLLADLPKEKVSYDGRISLKNLDLLKPVEGRKIRDGDIEITLKDGRAVITGTATVDGVKADIALDRPLDGGGAAATATVGLTLNDDDRARLGLDLSSILTGPITVSLSQAGEGEQAVEADLSKASLQIPTLGVAKKKGTAAKASFRLTRKGSRTSITDFRLSAGTLAAEGGLVFEDEVLVSAKFTRAAIREGDRLAVSVSRGEGGRYLVRLTGSRLDARGLVSAALKSQSESGATGALDLEATLEEVTGFNGEKLSGVNLAATFRKGQASTLTLTAVADSGASISATLTPVDAGRRLAVEVGSVGRLLRFLDVYSRVTRGRAHIAGTVGDDGVFRAAIDATRLEIVDEPALARLARAAEEGDAPGQTTAAIGRALFDLVLMDGRLTISDGVVKATSAGISMNGEIDFRLGTLDIAGTYLPARSFDSLLGKIPIIGQTVFAGGRAGLLGVSFRIGGSIDTPEVSVNPLSVIAPGIFRKLFEM